MDYTIAYIGLGSNLGRRELTLMTALKVMDDVPDLRVRRVSQFIETEPVEGPTDQGKYVNAVVEVETTLEPPALLAALHRLEAALGRDRRVERRWGPRTCDLDILLMGSTMLDSDELTVPHPRMHLRAFVLRGLAEIAPQAVHPVLNKTAAELLADLEASNDG